MEKNREKENYPQNLRGKIGQSGTEISKMVLKILKIVLKLKVPFLIFWGFGEKLKYHFQIISTIFQIFSTIFKFLVPFLTNF